MAVCLILRLVAATVALLGCRLPETAVPPTALPTAPPTAASPQPTALTPIEQEAPADLTPAWVIEVNDGDTIRVEIEGQTYTVRYIGINAPETDHPTRGQEPFGPEAAEVNRALVEGRVVHLERDVSDTDRFGRLLRYVWVGEGLVNAQMVRLGLARAIAYPPDVRYQDEFYALERAAREAGLGIWAGEAPTAPHRDVRITAKQKASEPELVTITNQGDQPVDLTGWWLLSVRGMQRYDFPAGFVLDPGASVTVYSGPGAGAAGGLYWTEQNMWNHRLSDPAELYDAEGDLVDRW